MFYRTCILFLALFTVSQVSAAVDTLSNDKTITWAGCGITKKAFMKELAKAYEAKTRSEERRVGKEFRSRWSPDH